MVAETDEIFAALIELAIKSAAESDETFALEIVALSTSMLAISSVIEVETTLTYKTFAERFSIYASFM